MADDKEKTEDHLSWMKDEEWSPFEDDRPNEEASPFKDAQSDPVWQKRIMHLARGDTRTASWLMETLTGVSFHDLLRLEALFLEAVSDDDVFRQMRTRIEHKEPWVSKEASRIVGDEEVEDLLLANSLENWIYQYTDLSEFQEDLKRFLTKLPIEDLRAGIVNREFQTSNEYMEIKRERKLLETAHKEVANDAQGSHRFVLKQKDKLPGNIRKNLTGRMDGIFRGLDYSRVTQEQLVDVASLKSKFPNASAAIDMIGRNLRRRWQFGDDRIHLRPIILTGEPGTGKTRLGRVLDVPVTEGTVAGHQDSQIFGVSGGWSSSFPSIMTTAVADAGIMNPLIMIDEIDKVRPSHNGDVWAEFLGLLEPTEACTYYERFLATNIDASGISWIFTANDTRLIPRPFLSRCIVCEIEPPKPDQLRGIIQSLVDDYALKLGIDKRFLTLTAGDVEYLQETWLKHQSVRVLAELLHQIFDENQLHMGAA